MTLAVAALEQMHAMNTMPTHVFLQAGVGSFAGAVLGHLSAKLGDKAQNILLWSHIKLAVYTSALQHDGKPQQ